MRRALACLGAAVLLAGPLASSTAAQEHDEIYPMLFPVIGENHFTDTFGAPRAGGRTHDGIDIMADKLTPVVAVADGTVGWTHAERGGNCCDMALLHDDGWQTWYVHLNNDTPGTDDGQGWGFADGIHSGVWVAAGTLIAWVGDSGNAEHTDPHLHFELHDPDGTVVNPYQSLLVAEVLERPRHFVASPFYDTYDSVHQADISGIFRVGLTRGCDPPADTAYCPVREVSRGEIAAFLRRMLGTPSATETYFTDLEGSVFAGDVNALASIGVALPCGEELYCPNRALTRAEMAVFVARALELPPGEDRFTDDDGHPHEAEIDAVAAAGIVRGCNPPENTEYCPDRSLSRAEMATFLVRALGMLGDS